MSVADEKMGVRVAADGRSMPGGAAFADRTRDRVARLIGARGPVTAGELAADLGLTAAAVRRHLDAMVEEGVVAPFDAAVRHRGRGRPATSFVLTDSGHLALSDTYSDLATSALGYVAECLGADGVADFAKRRAEGLVQRYGEAVNAAGPDAHERAAALATALSNDGYAASTRPVPARSPGQSAAGSVVAAIQLCQGHCPIQQVAAQYPQLCEAEQDAFAQLLAVPVRRLATLAHGDHVCTTHIVTSATTHVDTNAHATPRHPVTEQPTPPSPITHGGPR